MLSSMPHSPPRKPRATVACGSCRFRKVKCSGVRNPARDDCVDDDGRVGPACTQCAHLGLTCAFAPPIAKRRAGTRGARVQQLKQAAPPTTRYPELRSRSPTETTVDTTLRDCCRSPPSPSSPCSPSPPGHLPYSASFFLSLVPDYEQVVYPVNPIITPAEIRDAVAAMHAADDDAALVYSFAAITMIFIQTGRTHTLGPAGSPIRPVAVPTPTPTQTGTLPASPALMSDLMQRGLLAHRASETALSTCATLGDLRATVKRIMTCVFLEMSMISTRLFDRGFVMLREAIALLQTLKLPSSTPAYEIARCQRLYWECFLHERYLYIVSGRRPSVLPPLLSGRPRADPTIPAHVDAGFGRLIDLFCVLDDTFLQYWTEDTEGNGDDGDDGDSGAAPLCPWRATPPPMTAAWVERKQAELDAEEQKDEARSTAATLSELQHVDIFITRLWLRTLVWQLALARGLLRSAPPTTAHEGLSLHFPADRLSAQLRGLVGRLESAASIATHGSGILTKLFEITTTIADVLLLGDAGRPGRDRLDDLVFLVRFLFRFDKLRPDERAYIRDKVVALQQRYGCAMGGV
ncbi:hypothetical protein HMPREF1624_08283 [Sporothrix schenckii ATCC 58251]|uniref:Zn(2)-C6 fungal-type domain-containing protein n=1 Tax=Sporothrix schenckii (strain ATCC 58251 / de Perez 2211183) TaxID=1391915 RepID=U7PLP1_SPOS1|nr:hypothetical protein HMPREF1624_08283 [Sporothrix schenckii ATCC 58251]